MRRTFLSALCLLALVCSCRQGNAGSDGRVIGFYNLENLFDTIHDEGKNDYQFLPEGDYHWTEDKYQAKLANMASAIKAMADENGQFHAVLGVAEVENDKVLDDLTACADLAPAGYRYVHYESPDQRGIDVALLYRPDCFRVLDSETIPYTFDSGISFEMDAEQQSQFFTRDVLMVRGELDGEPFAFFVAHLPSRIGDKGADLRCRGAEIIYERAQRLAAEYPGIKMVVMGDMNDDPTDLSMTDFMHAKGHPEEVSDGEFFSPFIPMLRKGFGSLEYHGDWNIFDIIMVSSSLVNPEDGSYGIRAVADGEYATVFKRDFLTQQDGKFAGTPHRTLSYGEFINGYSDHYPTFIKISK